MQVSTSVIHNATKESPLPRAWVPVSPGVSSGGQAGWEVINQFKNPSVVTFFEQLHLPLNASSSSCKQPVLRQYSETVLP